MIWRFKIMHRTLFYQNPAMSLPSFIVHIKRETEPQPSSAFYAMRLIKDGRHHTFHAFGVSLHIMTRKPETWAEVHSKVVLRLFNLEAERTFERNRCAAIAANMQGRSADDIARAIMGEDA